MPPPHRISDVPSLRALAHPARLELIEQLLLHGSLTATQASELIGQSPSNCSFHLRQLAKFGLIERAGGGSGRERPWQVVPGGIGVDVEALHDAEFSAAASTVNDLWIARQAAAETEWARRSPLEPAQWQHASFSEFTVRWLTVEELAELQARMHKLLRRYRQRRDPAKRPGGSRPVRVFASAFPAAGSSTAEGL